MKCCMLLVSTAKLNKTGEIIPIKKHQFDTYAHISDFELKTMRRHLYLKSYGVINIHFSHIIVNLIN